MRKTSFALAFILGLGAMILAGCGGGSNSSTAPTTSSRGSVVLFGRDVPLCDVLSFKVTITGATLTPQAGGSPVTILSSAQSVTVDFAALLDFSTALNFASVQSGQYSQITLTLSNPQLVVFDVTKSPPGPTTIAATLTSSTVTLNLSPPLNVQTSSAVGLELDFNLLKSVKTDANGQVTGAVNPVFTVDERTVSAGGSLEGLDDLDGLVQSVTTTSTNPSFSGSFSLQTEGGQTLTVNVTSTTVFDGASGLSALMPKTFVEVNAFVDGSGNLVAKEVEVEEQEDPGQSKAAFVGLITSVTRDASGNATQFTLFVREEDPEVPASVPVGSTLVVNASSSTRFKITDNEDVNPGQLQFNASTLGLGQQVTAHGQFQPATSTTPVTLNATSVFLRMQSIEGNFSTLLIAGSDGKTGAFVFVPCSSIFGNQRITVFTFRETDFEGVTGLNALTPQPTLIVKGLLFFEQNSISLNGVTTTPPTFVLLTKEVHQLQ